MNRTPVSVTAMFALVLVLVQTACDWVDSTGIQVGGEPVVEIFLDNTPIGGAIPVNEGQSFRILTSRQSVTNTDQQFVWSETPLEQGNLPVCVDQQGFQPELVAENLELACKDIDNCQMQFDLIDAESDNDQSVFSLQIPLLDASVGVRYGLAITDSTGILDTLEYSFCLVSINDAPVALDDTFVVTEGMVLNVTPDTVNLLTNDTDDTDVSNADLAIEPVPVEPPEHASVFELGTDGSFTYRSSFTNLREDESDQFVYRVGDGITAVEATARIRIVAVNQAPRQLAAIAPLMATEGVLFSVDMSSIFVDPEGGQLNFSLSELTPLVVGSGLTFGSNGVLAGTPTAADVGSYQLRLQVGDGGSITEADVTLEIAPAPIVVPNNSPVFTTQSVFNQSVRLGAHISPIRPRFTDADGDTLTYSMAGESSLPAGVRINQANGVITGSPSVAGVFAGLRVRATDPMGDFGLSTPFTLTVTAQ